MDNKQTPAVFAAWNAVIADLAADGISKSRKNSQGGGYMFRGIDDVLNALSSSFARHGLAVRAEYTSREESNVATKSGGSMVRVTLTGHYALVSTRDGSETLGGCYFGEAFDSGDKAIGKAMSYAFKAFALQAFCIPTAGDHDTENQSHERMGAAPPAQREDDVPSKGIVITHGPAKGVSLYDATDADLAEYRSFVQAVLDDPAQIGKRSKAIEILNAIGNEAAARRE